jgi:hypothetical protein
MNATNIIIYYINNFLDFYLLVKIKVLQTYPLKMNLVPEIQTYQKRNLQNSAFNSSSPSQVASSSVSWLHCTLHILIFLF